jgi:hypothetical protein
MCAAARAGTCGGRCERRGTSIGARVYREWVDEMDGLLFLLRFVLFACLAIGGGMEDLE